MTGWINPFNSKYFTSDSNCCICCWLLKETWPSTTIQIPIPDGYFAPHCVLTYFSKIFVPMYLHVAISKQTQLSAYYVVTMWKSDWIAWSLNVCMLKAKLDIRWWAGNPEPCLVPRIFQLRNWKKVLSKVGSYTSLSLHSFLGICFDAFLHLRS